MSAVIACRDCGAELPCTATADDLDRHAATCTPKPIPARVMTPRELAIEVTRNTLEGVATSFEEMPDQRFTGRQVADVLRRTAKQLPNLAPPEGGRS